MSSNRNFGLTFTFVFLAIGTFPLLKGGLLRWWALEISLGFFIISLIKPSLLKYLNIYWTKFGHILSRFMNPIVMGVLFIVCVTPFGLLSRLARRDPLRLKLEPQKKSYWIPREKTKVEPESMRLQF